MASLRLLAPLEAIAVGNVAERFCCAGARGLPERRARSKWQLLLRVVDNTRLDTRDVNPHFSFQVVVVVVVAAGEAQKIATRVLCINGSYRVL